MTAMGDKLFELLPALDRLRDAQLAQSQGTERGPLQSFLLVLGEQLDVFAENLAQLYDDQFIETCAPWVIPYLGDLIGYQTVAPAVASRRAEVAHTIAFRRRKGTVLVMEQLARDVTGWGAHAVEMFQRLGDTQFMNHIRTACHYGADLRRWQCGAYANTGFDVTSHRVDVRRIAVRRGRHSVQNIAVFLWSLNAYSMTMTPATPVATDPRCFRFSPLGRDIPLFNDRIDQGQEIASPAAPHNVPDRLRRRVLCEDLRGLAAGKPAMYYGSGKSLALYIDGALAPTVRVCDLSGSDGSWTNLPATSDPPAVDPQLGRIALPPPAPGAAPDVRASFHYGFPADLGGGEYPRSDGFTGSPGQAVLRVPGDYATVSAALVALGGAGVVEITDSGIHAEPAGLALAVQQRGHVELRAADGCRPTIVLGDVFTITGAAEGALDLNGVLFQYAPPAGGSPLPAALLHVPDTPGNEISRVTLTHCTLVPGWGLTPPGEPDPAYAGLPTLIAASAGARIEIRKSIVGGLWIGPTATANLSDNIVDATSSSGVAYAASIDAVTQAPAAGGALTMTGCTVIGKVHAGLLSLVSECIVWAELSASDTAVSPPLWRAPLWALRRQEGCVRFSYLPAGCIVPRRFQCIEQGPGQPQPLITAMRYGDPSYCKLFSVTDDRIRRGAEDGGEMGAYHFVLAPLRETALRVRMTEYLPVGLEFGVFYET